MQKPKDQNLDAQKPCKFWGLWQPAYNSSLQRQTGDPQNKAASETSHILSPGCD